MLSVRWYHHLKAAESGSQTHFHRAIRKHGKENFIIEQIDQTNNKKHLNSLEIKWIEKLQPEYNMTKGGDGGWINDQTGKTWTVKDTSKMGAFFRDGRVHQSEEWKSATVGGKNYQCNYIIVTPWGNFETWKEALQIAKNLKKQGKKDVVTDKNTLKKYCKSDIILSPDGRRTFPEWRGQSTKSLGFDFIKKEKE